MNNPLWIKGVDSTTPIDCHYGLDITEKLTSILNDELSKAILPITRTDKIYYILEKIKASEL